MVMDATIPVMKRLDQGPLYPNQRSQDFLLFNIFWGGLFFVLCFTCPHCADECWDRTQDRCNWCTGSQTLHPLGSISSALGLTCPVRESNPSLLSRRRALQKRNIRTACQQLFGTYESATSGECSRHGSPQCICLRMNFTFLLQVIQTANGQQIIVQNVGQGGGSVQLAGGETLQQIQVPQLLAVLRIRDVYPGSEFFPSRMKDKKSPDPDP